MLYLCVRLSSNIEERVRKVAAVVSKAEKEKKASKDGTRVACNDCTLRNLHKKSLWWFISMHTLNYNCSVQ